MHSSCSYYYSSLLLLPPRWSSRSSIHASNSGSRKCNQLPELLAVTPSARTVPRLSSSFTRSSSSSNSSASFFSVVQGPKPNGSSGRTCNLLIHRCPCHRRRHQDSSVLSSSSSSPSSSSSEKEKEEQEQEEAREQKQEQEKEEDEEYQVLITTRSNYNHIVIVDTPKARMLLLDSTHNVHSMLWKTGQKWTGSYWDEFASLPALIPTGRVAILGLGGGTAAHLMLDSWPSLQIEGWEIDEIVRDSIFCNKLNLRTFFFLFYYYFLFPH
uniref:Uncharacterized protein LOC105110830 isoform X2 n=1 Tax=Rhizophora mucronata TaxID=61149 RepID=A0A2P2JQX1_RHIMU